MSLDDEGNAIEDGIEKIFVQDGSCTIEFIVKEGIYPKEGEFYWRPLTKTTKTFNVQSSRITLELRVDPSKRLDITQKTEKNVPSDSTSLTSSVENNSGIEEAINSAGNLLQSKLPENSIIDSICRVEPGDHPPGTPTDPDVPNFRTAGTRHPVPQKKFRLAPGVRYSPGHFLPTVLFPGAALPSVLRPGPFATVPLFLRASALR
ncbi:MAG: hypothetical protein LBP76_06200 [Treponema sp.]|nr:hypothetical protein [Treponema sp.]